MLPISGTLISAYTRSTQVRLTHLACSEPMNGIVFSKLLECGESFLDFTLEFLRFKL